KAANQLDIAVEGYDGRAVAAPVKNRIEHRAQTADSREFGRRGTSQLNSHDQRHRRRLGRVVQSNRLLDTVILNQEVAGFQTIDDRAALVFHQRRNQYHGGLRAKRRLLGSWRGVLRYRATQDSGKDRKRYPCSGEQDLHMKGTLLRHFLVQKKYLPRRNNELAYGRPRARRG